MKKAILIFALSPILLLYCTTKPKSLSDQLKTSFLSHLNKIDSSLALDSFDIIRIDTMNQKLFSVIEDTMYRRILARVQSQMASAVKKNDLDSMAFYQDELDYMLPTSDSLREVISKSDTTKKYGLLVVCRVQVSKKDKNTTDNIYYFLSRNMTVMNIEMIDTVISRLSQKWN
jgi:hypothetical protein